MLTHIPDSFRVLSPSRRIFRCLTALAMMALAASTAQSRADVVPGELLVGLKPATSADRLNDPTAGVMPTGLELKQSFAPLGTVDGANSALNTLRLTVRPGLTTSDAITALRQRSDVAYAEPNHVVRALATPNDPSYANQYALAKMQAESAWGIWQPKQQVIVAIVDTGVDSAHPDLTNKILRDSQGVVGFNALTGVRSAALDDHGHGTHCAGIAAAQTNNGVGVAGVAGWNGQTGSSDTNYVKIMPVKVLSSSGSGSDASVASGIQWAVDHGAKVVSLSLGSDSYSITLDNAVQYAYTRGVVVVAAAGNSGSSAPNYPGACANAISVAATDGSDALAGFSNYGSWVSVAAPGVNILSTLPTTGGAFGSNYGYLSGTSMATPQVAGEAALIASQAPTLTNAQISTIIKSNVDAYNGGGRSISPTGGRVNLYRALLAASNPGTIPTPSPNALRINVGGAYTTSGGVAFGGDAYAQGGSLWAWSVKSGTTDAPLYQTVRYGNFSYNLPAVAGNYTLKLYFSEGLGSDVAAPGQRLFNVTANGSTLLSNFDIVQAAGGQGIGVVKSFPVASTGAGVRVAFQSVKFYALVSAIELVPDGSGTTPPPTPTPTALRINVGGAYTTSGGVAFGGDAYAQGGSLWAWSVKSGTTDAPLYQTVRYGNFSYNLPAVAGNYTLKLYFAEGLGSSVTAPGQRVFDVGVNGTIMLPNFDVVKEAGGQGIGIVKSLPVTSTGAGITVTFTNRQFYAMVSAIELIPSP